MQEIYAVWHGDTYICIVQYADQSYVTLQRWEMVDRDKWYSCTGYDPSDLCLVSEDTYVDFYRAYNSI